MCRGEGDHPLAKCSALQRVVASTGPGGLRPVRKGFETAYLRQGAWDDAGDVDELLKALSRPAVKRIVVVSVTPPAKPLPPRAQATLTGEQQALAVRPGFVVGRAKLEDSLKALSPGGTKSGDEWKRTHERADKLRVEAKDVFPECEGDAFADIMNVVLVAADRSNGSERRSWEEQFGA